MTKWYDSFLRDTTLIKFKHLFCDTFIHCVTLRICDEGIADLEQWIGCILNFDEVSEFGNRILEIEI